MAAPRPLILVTPWRRELPTFLGERTLLDTVHPAYGDRVVEAGGLPVVVPRPPAHDELICDELLARADGLVLTGGGDVDPATYGEPPDNALLVDRAADDWEVRLVRGAAARRVPTLGICRGAQIMALAFGGRLHQSLPPEALHGDLLELNPDEVLRNRHWVDLTSSSLLRSLFGAPRVHVNTVHHHAVADPGALSVNAVTHGALIEGVEVDGRRGGWSAIGVQWHPEKMDEPEQRVLFRHLVRCAEARAARRGERPAVASA